MWSCGKVLEYPNFISLMSQSSSQNWWPRIISHASFVEKLSILDFSVLRQRAIARLHECCAVVTHSNTVWIMPSELGWDLLFLNNSFIFFLNGRRTLTHLCYWAVSSPNRAFMEPFWFIFLFIFVDIECQKQSEKWTEKWLLWTHPLWNLQKWDKKWVKNGRACFFFGTPVETYPSTRDRQHWLRWCWQHLTGYNSNMNKWEWKLGKRVER